ncbi:MULTISPECIES: DUF418 domain-containing protein [Staphylococcus]|uniref:DUF418 domain-containing protein n=3 Tax=Staphylococcus haemolyticus TaxID=1283 RepID=A0A2K0AXZ0_STAHA|nr:MULTISPECIES: DUF418 domain-containing protein [Staphylococcus]AVH46362.1 DUF418 domain-containing protein [Staphylococcus haemolyticus]MCH4333578.1 DUF418 domain-containing protein [Staphylococcus haemolyticus]MCH4443556.1 DUF418 domain-containing protein [Staphylococcus haemolyticus]OFQ42425.1 hypothetical protein HMPREF2938_03265 [Staphylococcus sp. HMSC075F12]PNN29906.1 DUF418 domain-containing protein [Staphylococcus haemolyticus]
MKRITIADSLRGFSLLGIFLANLLIFQFSLSGKDYIEHFHLNPVNQGIFNLIIILVEESFLPIFAILFGFSMDKLYQSMKLKGLPRPRLKLLRRAIFLLILGFIHASYIWEGDILLAYSLAMLCVIPFISLSTKAFKWFNIVIISLMLVMGIWSMFDDSQASTSSDKYDSASYIHKVQKIYTEGSYNDIHHVDDIATSPKFAELEDQLGDNKGAIFLIAILFEIPLFTLGIFLSRCGWFEKDARHFWSSKLFIYLIPVSIIAKSTLLWLGNDKISGTLVAIFGPVLSLGYMSLFKYLYQHYEKHPIFKGLENAGKISLTVYITQSIIGTLIFYSYGLGLFGKDILIYTSILFVFIYIVLVLLATLHQRHFRYGPLEYLLRMFTYWKWHVGKRK